MTYVAAEPTEVTLFTDQHKNNHESREEALQANFESDFESAIKVAIEETETYGTDVYSVLAVIESLAQDNPEFLRIVLGDRGFT